MLFLGKGTDMPQACNYEWANVVADRRRASREVLDVSAYAGRGDMHGIRFQSLDEGREKIGSSRACLVAMATEIESRNGMG